MIHPDKIEAEAKKKETKEIKARVLHLQNKKRIVNKYYPYIYQYDNNLSFVGLVPDGSYP